MRYEVSLDFGFPVKLENKNLVIDLEDETYETLASELPEKWDIDDLEDILAHWIQYEMITPNIVFTKDVLDEDFIGLTMKLTWDERTYSSYELIPVLALRTLGLDTSMEANEIGRSFYGAHRQYFQVFLDELDPLK